MSGPDGRFDLARTRNARLLTHPKVVHRVRSVPLDLDFAHYIFHLHYT